MTSSPFPEFLPPLPWRERGGEHPSEIVADLNHRSAFGAILALIGDAKLRGSGNGTGKRKLEYQSIICAAGGTVGVIKFSFCGWLLRSGIIKTSRGIFET